MPFVRSSMWTEEDTQRQLGLFAKHIKSLGNPKDILRRMHDDPKLWGQVFCDHLLREEDTGERYGDAAFHQEFYDICGSVIRKDIDGELDFSREGGKRGFAGAAPRGHAKSTITLICCLWALCEGWKRFIAVFSGTDDQAEKIGMNLRAELEENPFIRIWYGDLSGLAFGKKWTTKDFTIVRTQDDGTQIESTVMVRGCGASVRGARNRGARPDLVLLDDVDKDDTMRSATQREWLFTTWWSGQVVPMLHPLRGSIIIIGTILHFDSLLSRILSKGELYETRIWKCYDDDGNSVWPERFTNEYLRSLQKENPIAFAFEYLNDPTQTGLRPFGPEHARFYDREEVTVEDGYWYWRRQRLDIFAGVDPAISEEEDACEFAIVVIGITKDKHDIIILRILMDRIDVPTQLKTIEQFADAFPQHRLCGIETVNYQKALPQLVRQQLRAKVRVHQLTHGNGKAAKRRRIIGISPLWAQGRIWFSKAAENTAGIADTLGRVQIDPRQYKLYKQMTEWPVSDLEDGVDALSSAIETAESTPFFAPGTFTGNWASATG